MTIAFASDVKQTSQSTGTNDFVLDAAVATGFRKFADAIGNGVSTIYKATDGQGNWEYTLGTVSAGSPDSLSRDSVLINSLGTTAKINFGSGTKTIAIVPIAELMVMFSAIPSLANDQILQRKGGAWTVRTPAQVIQDTGLAVLTADNQFMQRVSGAIVGRTPAQVVQALDAVREGFSAYQAADQSNITGDATDVTLGSWTELSDVGSCFDASGGLFTAPANGKINLIGGVSGKGFTSSHNEALIIIKSSSGKFVYAMDLLASAVKTGGNLIGGPAGVIVDLAAGETIGLHFQVSGGTKVAGIQGGATGVGRTWLGGIFFRS